MKKTSLFFLAAALLFGLSACSTLNRMQGDLHYDNLDYQGAISYYGKYLAKKDDPARLRRLADSYQKIGAVKMAEAQYQNLVNTPLVQADDYFHYVEVLMQNRNYDRARLQLHYYLGYKPEDKVAQAMMAACDSITEFKQDSFKFSVKKLPAPLNLDISNYSPTWFENGFVFASERKGEGKNKLSPWTGQPYTDLYYAEISGDSIKVSPKKLEGAIDGIYNEGPLVLSPDGSRIYFTRNNYLGRKRGKSMEYVNNLKVYEARLVEGKWDDIRDLPFNSDDFSNGHPALSPDGNTLYVVSDRPGGQGGTDLWAIPRQGESWGQPQNLGPQVNTPGEEMFPWVGPDGTLYFSSNGWPGLGGLDVFKSLPTGEKLGFSQPQNMHYPINSSRDDFGYILDPGGKKGMFSSNRDHIRGVDDLFTFKENPILLDLKGIVVYKGTQKPISNALVELRVTGGREASYAAGAMMSATDGSFSFPLEANADYDIHAVKEGCFGNSDSLETYAEPKSKTFFVKIELDTMVIGKPIVLKNIYYDFDKWDIRPDARPDLDMLVKVMEDNPDILIELSSHTDCRGSNPYNQALSQKRAQSAVDYIVAKGVSATRIYAKGYGETQPVNECVDGKDCPEELHQANRRTEFKVVKRLLFEF